MRVATCLIVASRSATAGFSRSTQSAAHSCLLVFTSCIAMMSRPTV